MDTNAVQRHRNIILDCLRDGDISIRRRALELSYALINEANVRVLTRELLSFLEVADNEFKLGLTTQLSLAAEKLAPNKRWHIDTMLRVLKVAGNYVREEVLSAFLRLTCHTPELQTYTTQRLYALLHADFSQESLTLAAVWAIGEFGDVLTSPPGGGSMEDEDLVRDLTPKQVVDLVSSLLDSPYANSHVRQWVLTSLAKLAVRFANQDGSQATRIQQTLSRYETSVDLELQQRSVEYDALLSRRDIREGVLEAMPPPEIKTTMVGTVSEKRSVGSTRRDKDALLDLMGMDDTPGAAPSGAVANASSANNTHDLLADIFGGGSSEPSGSSAAPVQPAKSSVNDILDLFGSSSISTPAAAPAAPAAKAVNGGSSGDSMAGLDIFGGGAGAVSSTPAPAPAAAAPPASSSSPRAYTAFSGSGLTLTLTPRLAQPTRPELVSILATFTSSGVDVTNLSLQAAVPKSQKLQMLAASSSEVKPGEGGEATQQMRVMLPNGGAGGMAAVRLRLRIGFKVAGREVQEQVDFAGFQ